MYDDLVERLLAREVPPLNATDLPVFPKHWPKDSLCVEAADVIKRLSNALRDIIDADAEIEVGGVTWTGKCGAIAQEALKAKK